VAVYTVVIFVINILYSKLYIYEREVAEVRLYIHRIMAGLKSNSCGAVLYFRCALLFETHCYVDEIFRRSRLVGWIP